MTNLAMRTIEFQGKEVNIKAGLHALVFDPEDNHLLFASFIDADSSVKSMASNIATNATGSIYVSKAEGDYTQGYITLKTLGGGNYKYTVRKIGDSSHGIVRHVDCMPEYDPKFPIIIAFDGDLIKTVGERLCKMYTLPNIPEWHDFLFHELLDAGYIKPLVTMSTQYTKQWQDIQAVQLLGTERKARNGREVNEKLPESLILEIISQGLRSGQIFLPEGTTEAPEIDPTITTLSEYLKTYAPMLVDQINRRHPPVHAVEEPIYPYIAELGRLPVPTQAIVANAIVRYLLLKEKSRLPEPLLNSDMGTGKSQIAMTVAYTMYRINQQERGKDRFVTLVQAPGSSLRKWINKEIRPVLPMAHIHEWNSANDALKTIRNRDLDKPGLHVVVVSRDKMKRGARFRFAGVWKRVIERDDFGGLRPTKYYAWHCPKCSEPLKVTVDKDEEQYVEWSEYAHGEQPEIIPGEPKRPDGTPLSLNVQWKPVGSKLRCKHCGETLARPMLKGPTKDTYLCDHSDMSVFAKRRASIQENKERQTWGMDLVIRDFRKDLRIDLYVADELHELKGGGSAQGVSFGTVASACKHVLGLTGTLTGGKASDIFHILWRTATESMKKEGFTHKSESSFSRRYGVFQEIVRQTEEFGAVTRRKKEKTTTKEMPGLSPALYYLIMESLVSLELENLGLPLVKLDERPVFIDMSKERLEATTKYENDLKANLRKRSDEGQRGAHSCFIPAVITKADMPFVPEDMLTDTELTRIPRDVILDTKLTEKEEKLLELVAKEKAEGRRVMVYTTYVGKFRQAERLVHILQQAGYKAAELKATDADKRTQKIDELVEEGIDVIVCNMRLVSVAIDLLEFPTIVYFQLNDSISVVRQAAKRAWRLGQTRECRVYYLVWRGSYQTVQFERTMMKRAHALLLEGRIDRSELAEYGSSDVHASLTKTIVEAIQDTDDLAAKWKKLAAKDIPQGIELLSEEELGEALKRAFEELTDQTRVLCGKAPIHKHATKKEIMKSVLEESKNEAKQQALQEIVEAVQMALFDTGMIQTVSQHQKVQRRKVMKAASGAEQLTLF